MADSSTVCSADIGKLQKPERDSATGQKDKRKKDGRTH